MQTYIFQSLAGYYLGLQLQLPSLDASSLTKRVDLIAKSAIELKTAFLASPRTYLNARTLVPLFVLLCCSGIALFATKEASLELGRIRNGPGPSPKKTGQEPKNNDPSSDSKKETAE